MLTVGVDVGGTFTDIFVREPETGIWVVHKVPSTPPDFYKGFLRGVSEAVGSISGVDIGQVQRVVHGTTVATNAILTQSGARIGFLLTEGCEDILYIGVGWRPRMYDLQMDPVEPLFLAPRRRCRGVVERLDAHGNILTPLDENKLCEVAGQLVDEHDVEVFVVCLLHSYANPAHEIRAKAVLQERYPDIPVTLSSEVLPRRREYRRLVVSGFDAYVKPVVSRYIKTLAERLAAEAYSGPLHVMQSNGGVAGVDTIMQRPVRTVLSGLAAGVIGAAHVGEAAGYPDCISLDMGGTSADVALIREGRPVVTTEGSFEDYPLHIPMIDVRTIGAGGSSIAYVDDAGGLRVGPRSAGADPGPACYNRGGEEPTVTDASFVLGYLNPATFAGDIDLDLTRSYAAIEKYVAEPLGLDVPHAALGIHRIVNSNMAQTLRLVSIKRGYDPRRFAFIPFGGAGTVHAGRLAEDVGMRTIVIPPAPGVLSAMGLMLAPVQHESISTYEVPLDQADLEAVRSIFARLDAECVERMETDGVPDGTAGVEHYAEMRYVGQSHQLEVPLNYPVTDSTLDAAVSTFHQAHERTYGHSDPDAGIELVSLRAVHRYQVQSPSLARPVAKDLPSSLEAGSRRACFSSEEGYIDVAVMSRESLKPGDRLQGPAIIEQPDTTVVVYPNHEATVDEGSNIIVTL